MTDHFCIPRGLLDDEGLFGPPSRAPLDRRSAFLWLVEHATSQNGDGGLQRGQVATSIRTLAAEWGWKRTKVSRALHHFREHSAIDYSTRKKNGTANGTANGTTRGTANGTAGIVITICRYSDFYDAAKAGGTASGTVNGTASGTASETEEIRLYMDSRMRAHDAGARADKIPLLGLETPQEGRKEERKKGVLDQSQSLPRIVESSIKDSFTAQARFLNDSNFEDPAEVKDSDPAESSQSDPPAKYAFAGRLVRLTERDFDEWKARFYTIPDLSAELYAADLYYDAELEGKERKKWFHRVSAWLAGKHQKLLGIQLAAERAREVNPFIPPKSTARRLDPVGFAP